MVVCGNETGGSIGTVPALAHLLGHKVDFVQNNAISECHLLDRLILSTLGLLLVKVLGAAGGRADGQW